MAEDDRQGRPRRASAADMLRLTGVGLELAVVIGGLTYVGHLIDSRYGSTPWATLAGALLGLVGGCANAIRTAQRINQRSRS